ncbi:MAG: hypothetical protein E7322_04215 [Clostridiales bacterium]|nr:hypothetical protein [Clostridiales bacterium]
MAKTDFVSECIRESLPAPSPLAQAAINHAFQRIHKREIIRKVACVLLPLACAITIAFLMLPKGIQPPSEDFLASPAPSPASSPEPPETETVFVGKADPYYHAFQKCASIKGSTEPMMERAARLNGLYPCPVCCEFETKQPHIEAMAIGDILILRYEDEYLYEPQLTSVFGYDWPDEYKAEIAHAELADKLHAKRYIDFLTEANKNRSAECVARAPEVLHLYPHGILSGSFDYYDESLKYPNQEKLSARYIGSSHYAIYYPDFNLTDTIDVFSRINGYEIGFSIQNGKDSMTSAFTLESITNIHVFDVRRIDESGAYYASVSGSFTYSLYHTGNEHVLVVKQADADPFLLKNVTLRIGDSTYSINGFMAESEQSDESDKRQAKYAFVLTDQEAASIKNGAGISIETIDFEKIARESPFAYTPVRYGTGSHGVINKSGQFVIAAEYKDAWSYQDLSGMNAQNTIGPIFLKDYEDTIYIHDGETLERIAWYALSGENSAGIALPRSTRNTISVETPGIYALRRDDGVYLLNRNGERLLSFLYGKDGNYENNLHYSAVFAHGTAGYPECLVLFKQTNGYTPDRMWVSDLNGNRLSPDFMRLIPFIWNEGTGIFISITYDREYAEKYFFLPYYEKGLPFSGYENDRTFRVGLVDQYGNTIAACEYISLEVIDDFIYLTKENGEQDLIDPSAFSCDS